MSMEEGCPAASATGPGIGGQWAAAATATEMDQLRERLQQLETQQAAGWSWSSGSGWWKGHQRWWSAGDDQRAYSWKGTDEVEERFAKDTSDPPEWPGWEHFRGWKRSILRWDRTTDIPVGRRADRLLKRFDWKLRPAI